MKRILPVAILFLLYSHARAQDASGELTPGQILRLARSTYEQGRLNEVTSQLDEKKFFNNPSVTKAEKVEGYKILCQTYIYLEEPEKADAAMLSILETDPYFKINPAVDPAEFVALYNTFRTTPIYRIGAKLGANASKPNVTESTSAVELGPGSKFNYLIGLQFGASFDLPLRNTNFTIHADALFVQRRFESKINVVIPDPFSGEDLENKFTGAEKQTWISIPITVEYKFWNKKFNPYVAAGFAVDYLFNAQMTASRVREGQTSINEKTIDFKPYRENLNISAVLAAGVKLPIAGGFIVPEVRLNYGLTQIGSKKTAFANQSFAFEYGYADPVFKLNSLGITASYIHNIFNPKKLVRKK